MKKIIILLLCCGVLVSMVGCGGNTASTPTDDSPPTMVLETVIKETPTETIPLTTAVEPTEKEKDPVHTESKEQATEQTVTSPITTKKPTEELQHSETKNILEENDTFQTIETTSNIASQHTESEITVPESTEEIVLEPETTKTEFDIHYWIAFAKEYAASVGLTLDSTAVDCWDNPIRAGVHCIYLERDIKSRLNRYAKDNDITAVWIWVETTDDRCYDIYIGYA